MLTIDKLTVNEEILRDLYLRKLALGELQGPLTGYPNIDKPWLKHYTEEQVKAPDVEKTAYRYLYDENKDFLDDEAISFFNKNIKFGEVFSEIEKVAKSLKQIGVNKGDVVTICLPNTPEAAYIFYACSKIGAIADFIDPRENSTGIEKYLNISNPKHLIMLDACFEQFSELFDKKNIKNVVITSAIESLPYPVTGAMKLKEQIVESEKLKQRRKIISKSDANFMTYKKFISLGKLYEYWTEEKYEKDCPVAIVHTGGTTGVPKGVLLSNDNLNALANQLKNCDLQFKRYNSLLGVMPEFVGYGLSVGLHTSMVCGMRTIMVPKYEPEKIPELILKYKPNCMAGSPAHWETIANSPLMNDSKTDLSFFKAPIEGGDTLNVKIEEKVNKVLDEHGCEYKIQKGYGLTEKCSAVSVCFNNDVNEFGSVGVPFTKTIVAVYDNDTGENLRYDQLGEICVSAPDVMLEYYNNEEETNGVIKTHKDGQSWLHTGDLGYVNSNGVLYIVGRIKDMIIRYDGIKIYPSNVERIMVGHPAIESIAVLGVNDPEHMNGEIPVAFTVLSNHENGEDTFKSIEEYAKEHLVDYALPTAYYEIDKMPKTQVGKVDKKVLRKELKNVIGTEK